MPRPVPTTFLIALAALGLLLVPPAVRPTAYAHRFTVVGTQGGGIAECSYWRARAPLAVLRDLHVTGLIDASGTSATCGKTG